MPPITPALTEVGRLKRACDSELRARAGGALISASLLLAVANRESSQQASGGEGLQERGR